LARNLENREYAACSAPDLERREDRQISRTLNQVQKDIVAEKNRVRRFLDFHGLNAGLPEGNWTDRVYRNLRELPLTHSLRVSLDAYLRIIETLLTLRKELLAELKALTQKDRYRAAVIIKQSVPGIGWLTAIRLTLEWGDLSRFPNGKSLAKFTGLTCREYSTGETVRRGRITGQSLGWVRAWLIECAWRAIRKDPALQDKFQRVWRNSGSKKKALVAVARKIAVRIFALERSGELYCLSVAR
jgi:transposase